MLGLLKDMAEKLLQKKESDFIGKRLHLVEVSDGETLDNRRKNLIYYLYHIMEGANYDKGNLYWTKPQDKSCR